MTFPGLQLTAGLVALMTMGLIACADREATQTEAPVAPAVAAPMDNGATMTPPSQLPSAPPEIVAPGDGGVTLDSTDATGAGPANPPPVLRETPPT